jgi:hypothetical protein
MYQHRTKKNWECINTGQKTGNVSTQDKKNWDAKRPEEVAYRGIPV